MRAHVAAAALTAIVLYGSTNGPVVADVEGRRVQPLESEVAVLVFTRTDCPISNRYAPEIARIHERFLGKNVVFWLVYVDPARTADEMRRHRREFGYPFHAVMDGRHELVKVSDVRTTPEVAVFHRGTLVYRGRIDDRYLDFGRSRPEASSHDLEDVLRELTAGKVLPFRSTKAVGCFIEDVR